jgi:hypothetical protein
MTANVSSSLHKSAPAALLSALVPHPKIKAGLKSKLSDLFRTVDLESVLLFLRAFAFLHTGPYFLACFALPLLAGRTKESDC